MKIARLEHQGHVFHGVVEKDHVRRIDGEVFGDFVLTKEDIPLENVRLLSPIEPPNVIAIGLNYKRHAVESGMRLPERPVIFLKATTSVIGPEEAIRLPAAAAEEVDYEAELAVVIGKKAKNLSDHDALDYVLGYTCGNDVSARDCQLRLDAQWARGKSFDTFCPLGPWIETDLDGDQLRIGARINGRQAQESNTSDMIFSVREIVGFCSRNMTLLPGTVILTGTPEGVGFAQDPPRFLRSGDHVEIEIEGIGVLSNLVSLA